MAKIIQIKNPALPNKEETYLTARYTTGTALTVKNNDGWADNDILVAGIPGREQTEAGKVSGVTGNEQIDLDAALKFDFAIDTPLFRSAYDQISVEQKPSGGSFAEIAEGKVDIQWDERDGHTKVSVATGADSDTFRWRFYNTLTTTYSPYSGELPGTGLTQFHAGYLMQTVRYFAKMAGFKGVDDLDILRGFNRGQRQVDTFAPGGKWWFALTEDGDSDRVQSIAGTYKYDLTSNFRAMDVIQVLDVDNQRYNLSYTPRLVFDSLKVDNLNDANYSDSARQWTLLPPDSDNTVGYFGVDPTPETTGIYFYRRYWRFLPELTNFASRTLIPLPEILVNFSLFEIARLRENSEVAMFYWDLFKEGISMLNRLQRRQIGQAEIVRWRGHRGFARLFGSLGAQSLEALRENYWNLA